MIGPLSYIGGKRRLAPTIIKLLPPHVTYVEPFAGGAQVFFHKPPSRVEVLNDLDGEIVNFLRVTQAHHQELARWLTFSAASRSLFTLFSRQAPELLTDIQRAARFLYLQKNCFGGRRHRRSFRYAVTRPLNFRPERLPDLLMHAAERLREVQIESLPYEDILRRYDRPTTLFYCDPPYQGLKLYQHNLPDSAFELLARRLAGLRGQFLLSINDTPLIRRLFHQFPLTEVRVSYTSSRTTPMVSELLYGNFPLPSPVVEQQGADTDRQ
jgi:DNA adenine methylase